MISLHLATFGKEACLVPACTPPTVDTWQATGAPVAFDTAVGRREDARPKSWCVLFLAYRMTAA